MVTDCADAVTDVLSKFVNEDGEPLDMNLSANYWGPLRSELIALLESHAAAARREVEARWADERSRLRHLLRTLANRVDYAWGAANEADDFLVDEPDPDHVPQAVIDALDPEPGEAKP